MNIKDVKIGDFVAQIEAYYAEIVRLTEENARLSKDNELVRDANDRLCKSYTKLSHENAVLLATMETIRKETKEEVDVLQKSRAYWRDSYFLLKEGNE